MQIDFFWDPGSTNTYFAWHLLKPIAQRYNVEVVLQPFNLGYVFRNLADYDKAITEFETVLKRHSHHPYAHAELAKTYAAQNRIDDAIREYQMDIEISPNRFFSHYDLALLYKKKHQLKAARDSLETAALIDSKYPHTCEKLHEVYLALHLTKDLIPRHIKLSCNADQH